jgi:hypothetical protein
MRLSEIEPGTVMPNGITQKHLEEGKPRNCMTCPLAIATMEALGLTEVGTVVAGYDVVRVFANSWVEFASLILRPLGADEERKQWQLILDIDKGRRVEPTTIYMVMETNKMYRTVAEEEE